MKTVNTILGAAFLLSGFATAYSCREGRETYCCAETIDRLSDLIIVGKDCTVGKCDEEDYDGTQVCADVEIPNGKEFVVLSLATTAALKNMDL